MYYDVRFRYGPDSWLAFTQDVVDYFDNEINVPEMENCDCGGTIMTPTHDFSAATEGYKLSWNDKHKSPKEYAIFGWAKANG